MRFALNDDQQALKEAVRGFLDKHASSHARRQCLDVGGHDPHTWTLMAQQLGLHGIALGEEHGGAGGGLVELAIVMEETGRALLCSPYFATVVLAAMTLQLCADQEAGDLWLPSIAAGDLIATLAVIEGDGSWSTDELATRATERHAGWTLDGHKDYVIDGMTADLILVAAVTEAGPRLFAVDADAPGVTRRALPALDQTRPLAALSFDAVPAHPVGAPGSAGPVLSDVLDVAGVALAAEQVGGAQACLDMAVAHVGSRVQFGRPIGSFQAIKHKCADMLVEVETSRAMVADAAWSVDAGRDDVALRAHLTRSYVSDAYVRTASQNLQVHGGIGFTWEHDAHLYFKRATSSARLLGSAQAHREQVATLVGL